MHHKAEGLTRSVKHAGIRPIRTGDSVYRKEIAGAPMTDNTGIKVKTNTGDCIKINPKPFTVVGTGGFANTVHVCNSTDPTEVHKYVAAHVLVHADEINSASSSTILKKLNTIDRAISSAVVGPQTSSLVKQMTPMIDEMKVRVASMPDAPSSFSQQESLQKLNQQVDGVLSALAKPKTNGGRRKRSNKKPKKSYIVRR